MKSAFRLNILFIIFVRQDGKSRQYIVINPENLVLGSNPWYNDKHIAEVNL